MGLQDGTRKVSEAAGARWRFYVRIMLGSCAEYPRIVFILAEAIQEFLAQILNSEFRGRRSIWWGLRVTLLAARIVKITSHDVTWQDTKNHIASTWHDMPLHHITWHHTSQITTLTHHRLPHNQPHYFISITQPTTWHQNTSPQSTWHHNHGTAEGSFTPKNWFGHRAGRSPCAHSIGKFFLCYI